MYGCAGLSIERPRVTVPSASVWFTPARPRGTGRREKDSLKKFAGLGSDGPQPGRIGFMSTRRREQIRRRRARCMESVALPARFRPGGLNGQPGEPDRRSKTSLPADHRIQVRVHSATQDTRRALPPPGAGPHAADCRSSHPGLPTPARTLRFYPPLPPILAWLACLAERYDGKRDLYIQHAARNAACNS